MFDNHSIADAASAEFPAYALPGTFSSGFDNAPPDTGLLGVLAQNRGNTTTGWSFATVKARRNLYRAREQSPGVIFVCEGWAARFLQLPNGKRQVLSLVLPGEPISAAGIFDREQSFSTQAITDVRYCMVGHDEIERQVRQDGNFSRAWAKLVAREREWADEQIVDLGQRNAQERIAALILRLLRRFDLNGHGELESFPLPLRQQHIGDITGLTPVHVCRVLSYFKSAQIFELSKGVARILDRGRLGLIADSR